MVFLSIGVIVSLLLILATVYGFPLLFNPGTEDIVVNYANKKTATASLTNYKLVFGAIGLFCALLIILGLMELIAERLLPYKADPFALERFQEELEEIPNTFMPPPPPPRIVQPELVEVPDEEEIIEQVIIFDTILEPEPEIDFEIFDDESEIEEVVDAKIWNLDEISIKPQFPGGINKFYHFIRNNYAFPEADRRLGTEGIIYVKFIIDENGNMTNISILRGVNNRMDKETTRVLGLSPKWTPGKFGDKNVPVSYRIPIRLTQND